MGASRQRCGAALLASVLCGCPFTDHVVREPFVAPTTPVTVPLAVTLALEVRALPSSLGADIVGVKRDGYGNERGQVSLAPSVGEYVHEALAAELQRHGVRLASDVSAGVARLSVSVDQLFIEPEVTAIGPRFVGVLVVTAELELPDGGERFRRRFVSVASQRGVFMAGGHYDDLVPRLVEDALVQLIAGLGQALSLAREAS